MTDRIFPTRTFVRIDLDTPAWLIVEAGDTLGTIQPYSTFATYDEAVAAGYEGDNPPPPVPDDQRRIAALEDAIDDLILASLGDDDV